MPRKIELTFQQGAGGRSGRWKKRYRGKTHYLGSGRSRSDIESYRSAVQKWRKLKTTLDAELAIEIRPHDDEYATAIDEWQLVLSWSVDHGAEVDAARARNKLNELAERRNLPKPPPVTHYDRLWSRFRVDEKILEEIGQLAVENSANTDFEELRKSFRRRSTEGVPTGSIITHRPQSIDGLNPLVQEEIEWKDRISNQKKKTGDADQERTIGHWVGNFVAAQQQRVTANSLSAGRFKSNKVAVEHFRDWAGAQTDVSSISGRTLSQFHAYQLDLITAGKCASGYSKDRMAAAKSLIRWMWEQDVIENLPKNFDSNQLRFARLVKTPETLSVGQVGELLRASSGQTRLYILLGLNCGMTQKDISDLSHTDVNWTNGVITRKRSKTRKHEGVPVVSYRLWPETIELLQRFRSKADTVLVNNNGNRLCLESLDRDGNYKKTDNIKNAFIRVVSKTSFSKPFKLLRKTSSTLINSDNRFRGLDQLFLGHAPQSIAEKHYTATTEAALDEALAFLRMTYEVDSIAIR